MVGIKQSVSDVLNRTLDNNVRLAVTGLSRAGKTAFITSLVDQLLHSSTHHNLPLLEVSQEGRILGSKRIPHTNSMVPRFGYEEGIKQLQQSPPQWPSPTRDVSEIRLTIKYRSKQTRKKLFSETSTLTLDIVDYPGEWLLDLPMLNLSFKEWSERQFSLLEGTRQELAQSWLGELDALDLNGEADENKLEAIAASYTNYLHSVKEAGLHWVQPGRFVLPGELDGAPVLQFFPVQAHPEKAAKTSHYALLEARYKDYQTQVVKRFYREHFSSFDRQIILVDCLSALNQGREAFLDMRQALDELMHSFQYGQSSLLRRIFAPKIDKVLFAATKCDHVTPDQQVNLTKLLRQLVQPAWQTAAFDNLTMECSSIASIQATDSGFIKNGDDKQAAIRGTSLSGESLTLYPGDVPSSLPPESFWLEQAFEFTEFRPKETVPDSPQPHIRLDRALQFLIGDKLK